MNSTIWLEESDFHARVEAVMQAIETAVENAEGNIDADIDAETSGGILTLEFANGSKIIINRQTLNREIWVAAKSGGFHFRYDGAGWRDTRSGESLSTLLGRVIAEQSGAAMSIAL